ncbi:hypothetical protein GQF42_34410 [Streptomyces broussonetiae]|uniref:Uncharacterized protein n=1 Tax=Streptomyces broussonetiae TaxID=2686304 RepID=A0A6I6N4K0_9ACTN|nr:hypothetical protein [Streptomyces broussonetiae]QHA07723.1 hypothetical protein GQF42_34410 [Streptomyces broussonetiae]
MAEYEVTRLLVVTRGPQPRLEGIVSLRHLLTARRIDLHEERHAQRVLTLRARSAEAPATARSGLPPARQILGPGNYCKGQEKLPSRHHQ